LKALIVKKQWLDLILAGRKTWELRGSRTGTRGRIGLIESGSGQIKGTCELVGVLGPLSISELRRRSAKHQVPPRQFDGHTRYKRTFAWVIQNARRYSRPRPYNHPQGAVIWVNT
jgi:hypothetical protein